MKSNNSTVQASPIEKKDRLPYLDILRGIAILFIFFANIPVFSGDYFLNTEQKLQLSTFELDRAVDFLMKVFVQGKFYSIFSILFGIGFIVQLRSLEKSNRNVKSFFRRRMLGLLLFGLIHLHLIWVGDILTLYALLGFLLIGFLHTSDKKLIIWAVVLLLFPIVHWLILRISGIYYPYILFGLNENYWIANDLPLRDWSGAGRPTPDPLYMIQTNSILEFLKINIAMPLVRWGMILMEGRIFKVLGLFLIGLWAGKQILYNQLLEKKTLLRDIAIWGTVIGVPMNIFMAFASKQGGSGLSWQFAEVVGYSFGVVPLAIAYCALLALHYKRFPFLFSGIASVGRTALSNYIFQSLIAISIFYGIGFGLATKTGLTTQLLIAVVIFTFQCFFSKWWLGKYHFGPLEYLWRQMTYRKRISNRKSL